MYSHELNSNDLVTYETDKVHQYLICATVIKQCLEHAGKFEMDSEFGSGVSVCLEAY